MDGIKQFCHICGAEATYDECTYKWYEKKLEHPWVIEQGWKLDKWDFRCDLHKTEGFVQKV